ncbi:MAG: DUF5916 domain-containing protein [Thermoanaerobaculia bacterium]
MFEGRPWGTVVLSLLISAGNAAGSEPAKGPEIRIGRTTGPITIDGDLDDAGWQGATRVETWYETNPGDNLPAKLKNVGTLAYDDKFLYAGFLFADPDPSRIRAAYSDRDNVPSYTDYGGLILDTKGEAKTAILFLANPRGIQYDAITDDSSSEDSSPDWHWEAAGKITAVGWQLEIRIPFSSLRYPKADVQTWNVLLYRNYPRDFRYQFFSAKLPRDENCFICHSNPLAGLQGLPRGGNLVVAPYATAKEEGLPRDGTGSGLVNGPVKPDGGLDVKWTPNAVTAIDGTVNPDFSQVESDVAQLAVNQRFALFYSEKRPFFLEGIDLFATPIQAVYTRTITAPRWGARVTGRVGGASYTALVAEDEGGGSVILPGPNGSDFADQDFKSFVAVGRVRQEFGTSFASLLVADREVQGGGYNRVIGPDFQWRPTPSDTLRGQLLLSASETPNRPELAAEWDGRKLSGHAADISASHSNATFDVYGEYKDFGKEFRADDGPLIFRQISPGFGMDGLWSSFTRIRVAFDRVRALDVTIPRTQLLYTVQFSPSRVLSQISLDGFLGEEVDFVGARPGHGGRVTASANIRPTNHLELQFDSDVRWLNVEPFEGGSERRLFTAQAERLKATYTFTSRSYLRLIGQYVLMERNPSLYRDPVSGQDGSFSGSLLFAYKLNWQTVLFLGYGDNRTLTEENRLERVDRQFFLKVSYAFQR